MYAVAGLGVWLAMHESGVRATIAGVALGLLTRAREFGWALPKLVKAADEPPPLRWLSPDSDPERKAPSSQEFSEFPSGSLPLPMITVDVVV